MRLPVIGLAGLASCAAGPTPPPAAPHRETLEQSFFDWTEPGFSAEVHAARRARLAVLLGDSGGGVLLSPAADGFSHGETFRQLPGFLYLSGLELPNSVLALEADTGQATLFVPETDARFESATRSNDFPGRPLAGDPDIAARSGIDVRPADELDAAVRAWVDAGVLLRVDPGRGADVSPPATGFVGSIDPAGVLLLHLQAEYPDARIESAHAELARLRMVKGPEEVEVIRRACAITCAGIREAAAHVQPGVDERTLEGVLEASWKRDGAQRPAFDSIVKSGPNSLWPWRILAAHSDRRNRQLADGELVIFDVGCELDGYSSDVGRTFPASGRFDDSQARRLEMITRVSDAVIAAVRPGVTLAGLQRVAEETIPEAERPYMQTGLFFGHHVGLEVGDPSLADAPLEPGMVFTVEPWYYNHDEELAVFLEDMILVTETGAEILTARLPRSPQALERMVGRR